MASEARPRVVVTGMGAVSACGWGVPALHEGLTTRATRIGPFSRFDHRRQRTHVAGEVPGEPGPAFARGRKWGRASLADRFALFSAREALDQARLPLPLPAGRLAGLFFGSSTGGMLEGEGYFADVLAGVPRPDPRLMAAQQLNAPGDAVARAAGVEGPVETISSACASGALAIAAALDAVRSGEVDLALAGGSDSLCQITYSGFNALRAVDEDPCRPFRAERAGLSIGEGAAVLVLERLEDALARGARPLAEIEGAGASCDAGHMTAPDATGAGAALAIGRALRDAARPAEEIAFVNAHGTGTPLNDAAEYAALVRVFGERTRTLPVTSTKSVVGHLLGSSGAVEAVATALGLARRRGASHAGRRPAGPRDPGAARAGRPDRGPGGARRALHQPGLRRGQRRPRPRPLGGLRGAMAAAVVTGVGAVGSFGCGAGALRDALAAGLLRTTEVDRSGGYHRPRGARTAALVGAPDLSAWVAAGAARRMSPPSKLAVAAARMALAEAGGDEPEPASVALGTAFGAASFSERLLKSVMEEGPETASPFLFTECVANAPAAQVAIACRATGPNLTFAQREASPLVAVAHAAREVAQGVVARALAGAVDECPPLVHAVLDRFRALAPPEADGGETPRPFDRLRAGFVAGEGAAVLVIEREDAARARGARTRARVRAAATAFDPTATRVSWGHGTSGLARALRRMLDRAGLGVDDVDAVVSGASGAVAGDRVEALTLREAWGGRPLPPVLVPKAVTGEYGGAILPAALLALEGAVFAAPPGFAERDPELGVEPHGGGALPALRRVLVTSVAAGGAAAWLVLERP